MKYQTEHLSVRIPKDLKAFLEYEKIVMDEKSTSQLVVNILQIYRQKREGK